MIPRIFLAGDHPVTLMGVLDVIARSGAGVVAGQASSMDELQHLLRAEPCDLVVIDFHMSEMAYADALALLRDIRNDYPALPLLVMIEIGHAAVHQAMLSMGVRALVSKTGPVNEIARAIGEVLAGKIYISAFALRSSIQCGLMPNDSCPDTGSQINH